MVAVEKSMFDAAAFLASAGLGRKIVQLQPKQAFFSQGDLADSVFYLQKGRAKMTVVSQTGKEATIALLSAGDFVGEGALAAVLACDWPRPPPLPPALRSRLTGKRWSASCTRRLSSPTCL